MISISPLENEETSSETPTLDLIKQLPFFEDDESDNESSDDLMKELSQLPFFEDGLEQNELTPQEMLQELPFYDSESDNGSVKSQKPNVIPTTRNGRATSPRGAIPRKANPSHRHAKVPMNKKSNPRNRQPQKIRTIPKKPRAPSTARNNRMGKTGFPSRKQSPRRSVSSRGPAKNRRFF